MGNLTFLKFGMVKLLETLNTVWKIMFQIKKIFEEITLPPHTSSDRDWISVSLPTSPGKD